MSTFRRPSIRYGKTPEPETPYQWNQEYCYLNRLFGLWRHPKSSTLRMRSWIRSGALLVTHAFR
jgi:type IV secretory pathway TrbF-like protein